MYCVMVDCGCYHFLLKAAVKLYTNVVDSPYFLGHYMGALHGLDNGMIVGVSIFFLTSPTENSSSGKNMLRFLLHIYSYIPACPPVLPMREESKSRQG